MHLFRSHAPTFACLAVSLGVLACHAEARETNALGDPPPLSAYGNLPAIDQVSLSPDGSHVAMILRKDDDRVLVDYDVANKSLTQRELGKLKLRNLLWVDSRYLVVEASQTSDLADFTNVRGELYTATILDMQTGKSKSLYANWPDYFPVVATGLGVISRDGKRLIVAGGITQHHYVYNLNAFDPETTATYQIDTGGTYTNAWVYDVTGRPVARQNYRDDSHVWSLEMNVNGWHNVLSEQESIDTPYLAGLGRTPDTVVVRFNAGDKNGHYYEANSAGELTDLKFDDRDRVGLLHNPRTHVLAGYAYSDDWTTYDFFDPELKTLPSLVTQAFPGYRTLITDIAEDPHQVVVYTEGGDDSGTYFYVNFSTGANAQLGMSYPDIPPEWIAQKKAISYKAADGTEIHAYLTLPPGRTPQNLPLIVLPHGGPEARDDLGFDWSANAYASRGYAVLQPNFRGSSGYGEPFVEAGYGEWGRKMQTDLSDGIGYLASQGIVDQKRVCIVGYSYGGYAALAGATLQKDVYKCAVDYAGISDLSAMISQEGQSSGGSQASTSVLYWKRYLGDESNWDAVSPIKHVGDMNIPLLIMHGKDDTVVSYVQSKKMADALTAAGKPVQFVSLPGEDHWLSTGETRLQMLTAIVDFLQKNNPAY